MEKFQGVQIARLGAVGHMLATYGDLIPNSRDVIISDDVRNLCLSSLQACQTDLEQFKLPLSLRALDRFVQELGQLGFKIGTLRSQGAALNSLILDELDSRLLIQVSHDFRDYYERPTLAWEPTLAAFPSTVFDIEESSKCISLNRHTAAVFHAMRILEIGINPVAVIFNVATEKANWHIILQQIEDAIERKSKAEGNRWLEQAFYSEAALSFRLFKDAWRNHVMHVRQTFDEERSLRIYGAVRDFMNHLAGELREAS